MSQLQPSHLQNLGSAKYMVREENALAVMNDGEVGSEFRLRESAMYGCSSLELLVDSGPVDIFLSRPVGRQVAE